MPRLTDLVKQTDLTLPEAAQSLEIEHITADSRQVKNGSLFVALSGTKSNGLDYAQQAAEQGALAVLCAADAGDVALDIPVLRSANPRRSLSLMAAAFYNKQPTHIVAVTGTDGKTSTADFSRQFFHELGFSAASLGTIGITLGAGRQMADGTHTTPDPVALHEQLSQLAQKGCTHLAMEASSHGLHQHRLDGVRLSAAAFTSFARDHMDYHPTEEDYFNAKARLFSELLPQKGTAVLNGDDVRGAQLETICRQRGITILDYGESAQEMRIKSIEPHGSGQQVEAIIIGTPYTFDVPLAGRFQVMNILAAVGLAVATGSNVDDLVAIMPKLRGVPGRLEQVAILANGAAIYIDYAHTPAALANILRSLRPHTKNKLHVVFGCGGDRDKGKRPLMGAAASELADSVIVTDDNPRTEDAAQIRTEVLAQAAGALEVGDRRKAIEAAMQNLQSGDVLVIAGKGHEKTQTIGSEVIPFHDGEVVKTISKELELV